MRIPGFTAEAALRSSSSTSFRLRPRGNRPEGGGRVVASQTPAECFNACLASLNTDPGMWPTIYERIFCAGACRYRGLLG